MSAAEQLEILLSIDTISFVENTAADYGGAISISVANPVKLNFSDASFAFNQAVSGGAVALTSTIWETAEFQRCRFEYNNATRGGGLFLSGEGHRFLQGSLFRYNVAGETPSKARYTLLVSRVNSLVALANVITAL